MEQYQSNLDDDLRPAKRPRISTRESTPAQVKYPIVAGYRIGTYTAPGRTLTLADQLRIYDAWQGECHCCILIAFLAALKHGKLPRLAGMPRGPRVPRGDLGP